MGTSTVRLTSAPLPGRPEWDSDCLGLCGVHPWDLLRGGLFGVKTVGASRTELFHTIYARIHERPAERLSKPGGHQYHALLAPPQPPCGRLSPQKATPINAPCGPRS